MNLMQKMSAAFFVLTALCGCWTLEDPNKIYTIVLDSGKSQRTLKIPAAYIDEKNEKLRAKNGIRIGFIYPALTPFVNETPTEESVSVYIELISDPGRLSMSESFLSTMKARTNLPPDKNPARYVGKSGIYDVFEDTDEQTNSITTTYFTRDSEGNLLKFESVPGLRANAWRRYKKIFEVSYVFSPSLRDKQLEIDSAIKKLIASWLQQ